MAWQLYEVQKGEHFTVWVVGFFPLPVIVLGILFIITAMLSFLTIEHRAVEGVSENIQSEEARRFLSTWMLLTFLGWLAGERMQTGLLNIQSLRESYGGDMQYVSLALNGAVIGMLVAGGQSIMLRQKIPATWRWIIVTTAGWAFGTAIPTPVIHFTVKAILRSSGFGLIRQIDIAQAVITGFLVGLLQWFILKQHLGLARIWIPLTLVGFLIGAATAPARVDFDERGIFFLIRELSEPLFLGLITGAPLLILPTRPVPGKVRTSR